MRYGVPYKGSKNGIAEWIYKHFPIRDNFYDLFAGGCAITQIALMRQEYKNYYVNDINDEGYNLFVNAIQGKYRNEKRWISREDFFRLKDKDPYIKYCWSFGNMGKTYAYNEDVEKYKKAWHNAIFFQAYKQAKELGVNLECLYKITDNAEKYSILKQIAKNLYKENIYRLQTFERLNQLNEMSMYFLNKEIKINKTKRSYQDVEIKENSLIYCDIPYFQTDSYNNKEFDHKAFYDWCGKQKEFVIISEYTMPEDFIEIARIEKPVTLQQDGVQKAEEKLFIPKHQEEMYRKWKVEEGGYLFDFL